MTKVLLGDSFQKFLIVSALLHGTFFFGYFIKGLVFPNKIIIIPNSIRVDIVALPDKLPDTPQAASTATTAPPPAETIKTEPKTLTKKENPTKTTDAQKKALEKLEQMAALDKIKNDLENTQTQRVQSANKSVEDLKKNLPMFKGNQVTSGNSFTGMAGIASQEYWDLVKQHIQAYWMLPEWLSKLKLRARAVVMIDQDGRVRKREIYQSSGNPAFDDAALAAVDAASPFPVPPERIRDTITDSWMIFNFPD